MSPMRTAGEVREKVTIACRDFGLPDDASPAELKDAIVGVLYENKALKAENERLQRGAAVRRFDAKQSHLRGETPPAPTRTAEQELLDRVHEIRAHHVQEEGRTMPRITAIREAERRSPGLLERVRLEKKQARETRRDSEPTEQNGLGPVAKRFERLVQQAMQRDGKISRAEAAREVYRQDDGLFEELRTELRGTR